MAKTRHVSGGEEVLYLMLKPLYAFLSPTSVPGYETYCRAGVEQCHALHSDHAVEIHQVRRLPHYVEVVRAVSYVLFLFQPSKHGKRPVNVSGNGDTSTASRHSL